MKSRGARETGICNIREELYSECLDELIRQVTIECLQRGELLNHIKEQMKETINYYQKLYESTMSYSMRLVLREQNKKKKLEMREQTLNMEIENLRKAIEDKKGEIDEKTIRFEEEMTDMKDTHDELVRTMKDGIERKKKDLNVILTTPKQTLIQKK